MDVPIGPFFDAFAVPATVTPPGAALIETRGFWVSPLVETLPVGHDFQARDPRRVFVLLRSAVGDLKRGSVIVAVEYGGTVARSWRVDNIDRMEADHVRAIVVPV